jgi:palmitoyltransferase
MVRANGINDQRSLIRTFVVRGFHTLLTLAICTSLFLTDTDLSKRLSLKDVGSHLYVACYVSTVILSLLFYLITACIDPGFVPLHTTKCSTQRVSSGDEDGNRMNSDVDDDDNDASQLLPSVTHHHCGFCDIDQPLRARHCEDCGRCVRRYDHHCPWLDTCVGENNHRFFLVFIVCVSCASVWSTVIACYAISSSDSPSSWLIANIVYVIDLLILSFSCLVVIPLTCSHLYIAANNTTTWEFVSSHRITYLRSLGNSVNPFHQGYARNLITFLCVCKSVNWDVIYSRFLRQHTARGSDTASA